MATNQKAGSSNLSGRTIPYLSHDNPGIGILAASASQPHKCDILRSILRTS